MVSRHARFALKLAISAALAWIIISRLDPSELAIRIRALSIGGALLVVAMLVAQSIVASLRWEWIIRSMGYSLPFGTALRSWLIGQFLGQGLPSTLGHDAYRVLSLQRHGVPFLAALQNILVDRFTGVIALVVLTAATLPLLYGMVSNPALLTPLALAIAAAVVLTGFLFTRVALPAPFSRLPGAAVVSQFRASLRRLVETRHDVAWVAVPSLAAHMLTVLAAYAIARDGDTHMGFLQCLAIIPSSILISLVPVSIAGWGLREGAVVAGAVLIGIPAADGLFVSVVLGLGFLSVGLIGGAVWLLTAGKRPG